MIPLSNKCNQLSNLWQQLEFVSELESDLCNTTVLGEEVFVDFNTGK